MMLKLAWYNDVDRDVERALRMDQAEEAARKSQAIEAANRILESWILRSGGRILNEDGTKGSAELPAEYLEDLPDIIKQVEETTDSRFHVGIGTEPAEAMAALKVAEKRGKPVLYTDDIADEAEDESEEDPLKDFDDMSKAEGGPKEAAAPSRARPQGGSQFNQPAEAREATRIMQGDLSPTAAAPSPPASASFSAPGQPGQATQQPGAEPPPGAPENEEQLIQAVGEVLQDMKQQIPFFEQQVKPANPQAYQAVMGLVQAMIALAHQVTGGGADQPHPDEGKEPKAEEKPVEKAESDGPKEWGTPREKLDPQSWHIRYRHEYVPGANPESSSYVNRRGHYTATPNYFTQFATKDLALAHLREVAKRHSRPVEAYSVAQGVGPILKGEVDPETGAPMKKWARDQHGGLHPESGDAERAVRGDLGGPERKVTVKSDEAVAEKSGKVEVEPGDVIPPPGKLKKLYETARKSMMEKGEWPAGREWDQEEFSNGFYHERKEHPHLDDHETALTTLQHLKDDPKYYTKLAALEESGMLGKAAPAGHQAHQYPVGTHNKGKVKVVEPATGKTSWHSVRAGQKSSGDGHSISARLANCPSAPTPENPKPGQG